MEKILEIQGESIEEVTSEEDTYRYMVPMYKKNWTVNEKSVTYEKGPLKLHIDKSGVHEPNIYRTADLEVHMDTHEVFKDGERIKINSSCFSILKAFLKAPSGIVSRKYLNEILETNNGKCILDNTLNQHMNRTRKALGLFNEETYFEVIYRFGYRWKFEVTCE